MNDPLPMADYLAIYLRDHHAAGVGGTALARRLAEHTDLTERFRGDLRAVAAELEEDHDALERIMASLGVASSRVKDTLVAAAEKVGRLKGNGTVLSRSPLTNVIELEGLLAGVTAKEAMWTALALLAESDPRLDPEELARLTGRAQEQRQTLERCRVEAARRAFGSAGAPAQSAL